MIGRTISHYEIVAEVSRGGMGIVYRALDTRLGRARPMALAGIGVVALLILFYLMVLKPF